MHARLPPPSPPPSPLSSPSALFHAWLPACLPAAAWACCTTCTTSLPSTPWRASAPSATECATSSSASSSSSAACSSSTRCGRVIFSSVLGSRRRAGVRAAPVRGGAWPTPTSLAALPSPLRPQVLTQQALLGTVIALVGTWMYTEAAAKYKTKKATPPPATGGAAIHRARSRRHSRARRGSTSSMGRAA